MDSLRFSTEIPTSWRDVGRRWLRCIVFRNMRGGSVSRRIIALIATGVSFALCLLYLIVFPFQPVGMAAVIGIGTVVMMLLGRREDIVPTGITSTVVMCRSNESPWNAWQTAVAAGGPIP